MNRRQFIVATGTTATTYLASGLLVHGDTARADAVPRIRVAVMGFRHSHVWGLINAIQARPDLEIVAACEEDPATREQVMKSGRIKITHTDFAQMLAEPKIDVVAVGEYFGKRGRVAIESLRSGRAVLSDKPLCTTLADYEEIDRLSRERMIPVGMMLDLRNSGLFSVMRKLIQSGEIGDVREITVTAEHPLALLTRPAWFHVKGMHGGTINDIGIHAFDAIPWLTGLSFRKAVAARSWITAGLPAGSDFHNGGQVMLEMENGAGLIGNFSYVSPSSLSYTLPMYWRITVWGGGGVVEGNYTADHLTLYIEGDKAGRQVPKAADAKGGVLDSFVRELRGQAGAELTTADVLRATRVSLTVQGAADERKFEVAL